MSKSATTPSLSDLKQRASDMLAKRRGACSCTKGESDPRPVKEGGMVLHICGRCGGYTRPKET